MICEALPKETTAPAQARRLLDCVAERLPQRRLEDARLLVSEVVANAVEHVETPGHIEILVRFEDGRLRVEVTDPGDGFEPPPARDPANSRGWGLQFVRTLSDEWGVADGGGTRVWFEMAG